MTAPRLGKPDPNLMSQPNPLDNGVEDEREEVWESGVGKICATGCVNKVHSVQLSTL